MAVSEFNPESIKIEEKDIDLVIISSDDELEEDAFYKIKGKSILRVSGFEAMTKSSSSLSKLGKRRDRERKKDKLQVDDRKECHDLQHKPTSFFIIVRDPTSSEMRLPSGFKTILKHNETSPGLIKVQTNAGLSWIVNLVKEANHYYLMDGWKTIVDQLYLSALCYLVFEYLGTSTFRLNIYPQCQTLQMGSSFFHRVTSMKVDEIVLPLAFFNQYFYKNIPKGNVKLSTSKIQNWPVRIKRIGNDYVLKGWKRLVDEIPLSLGDFVTFQFVSTSSLRITAFNHSGSQMVLPKTDKQSSIKIKDIPESSTAKGLKENKKDGFTFVRKVESSRLRIPTNVATMAKLRVFKSVNLQYDNGPVVEFKATTEKSNSKRFVIAGWKDFMNKHGILKDDVCGFTYEEAKRIMVVKKLM